MSAPRQQRHEQMPRGWRTAAAELGTMWCTLMHDSPMWPIHGQYQCGCCGRSCPVLWTEAAALQTPVERIGRSQPIGHSLRSDVLPMVALAALLLVSPIRTAGPDTPAGIAGRAAVVLARYTAEGGQTNDRSLETIDIVASACELRAFVEER